MIYLMILLSKTNDISIYNNRTQPKTLRQSQSSQYRLLCKSASLRCLVKAESSMAYSWTWSNDSGRRFWVESKKPWRIADPTIFTRIAMYGTNIVTQAFVGHLGDLELAVISIATTVVVGFNFGFFSKTNTPAAQEKCITRLLLYHFCVNLPVMVVSYPVFRFMGMRSVLPLPSWKVVLSQLVCYFILEDFVFYWGHRILHTKWLYKHVHSVHHEYATPFGLTSEYAHPAEILFLGFATIIGPAITGPHLFTLWLWMSLRVLETVEAHCGYDFPWSFSKLFPLYGGADFHDYHHRLLYTKSGNYSSTFTYMDWLFGTDKGYRKLKTLQKDSK